MYFDTSLKTSRRDYSGVSSPGWAVWKGTFSSEDFFSRRRDEMTLPSEYKCNTRFVLLRNWSSLNTRTRRKGFRLPFRVLFPGGMTAVERGQSKQLNSRGIEQHCSPASRSSENACRIVRSNCCQKS
jgi:hypothetical protein